jgi:hypothetical protein
MRKFEIWFVEGMRHGFASQSRPISGIRFAARSRLDRARTHKQQCSLGLQRDKEKAKVNLSNLSLLNLTV